MMSKEDKKAALQYLMFLKEKRTCIIKGRGHAKGRKQRASTAKEDASLPTAAIELVMLSCLIDAKEYIPGAFMQADMEGLVHMKVQCTILWHGNDLKSPMSIKMR
jgi:hypothetical protein